MAWARGHLSKFPADCVIRIYSEPSPCVVYQFLVLLYQVATIGSATHHHSVRESLLERKHTLEESNLLVRERSR